MAQKKTLKKKKTKAIASIENHEKVISDIIKFIQKIRKNSVRSINAAITVTYWEIGRKIVEVEQKGKRKAKYGEELIKKMSLRLTKHYGRGFGQRSLERARNFYLIYSEKSSTVLTKSLKLLKSEDFYGLLEKFTKQFPLPWSAYIRLMSVENQDARKFYEEEAFRGGWSVRQLDRQINSSFFERTLLSKNKMAMLTKGAKAKPEDKMTVDEAIKDPYVLEFLNLKDEYSERELEEALILHLQTFLLEFGRSFTFVERQKRLRIGDQWFRVDLILFHRRLKCLVIIDLKVGKFSHADVGQMNVYLNYAKKHWTEKGENSPIGLILCADKNDVLAEYALSGMKSKILTAKYTKELPSVKLLTQEMRKTRKILETRKAVKPKSKYKVKSLKKYKK